MKKEKGKIQTNVAHSLRDEEKDKMVPGERYPELLEKRKI